MGRSGASLAAWVAAAASARAVACSIRPATVSWVAGLGRIRGGIDGTDTIRSDVPRSAASRAAHSTACIDSGEPSVPATTGFAAMSVLLSPVIPDVPDTQPGT
jgi:hypothetical protein